MPRFDPERMVKLISSLRQSLSRLEILGALDFKAFVSDPDKIGSCKYHFVVAIESCIDICNHVIARNGYRLPEDYADTFRVMEEAGAFHSEFAAQLRNMARFRNRLVHLYWEVDDRQLYDILQTRLGDIRAFLDVMATFLGGSKA